MGSTALFASVSVDGYATGLDGDLTRLHRWLYDFDAGTGTGYSDDLTRRFGDAGAIIFGRRTYDSGQGPWGDEEVFSAPVFVVTHEALPSVTKNGTVFTFVSGTPDHVLRMARAEAGERDVVLMGAPDVANQFLRAGLVDELLLHVVPILLGGGTRLFDAGLPATIELEPASCIPGPEVTSVRYTVQRAA